jgi:hypothetical protein
MIVTFERGRMVGGELVDFEPVGVNPGMVESVEQSFPKGAGGNETGACFIRIKGRKEGYLVKGEASEIIAKLNG